MPKKQITPNPAAPARVEEPTPKAKLIILLVDTANQVEPVVWQGRPANLMMRWLTSIARRIHRSR